MAGAWFEAVRGEAAPPSWDRYRRGFRLEWMEDPWDDVARAGELLAE